MTSDLPEFDSLWDYDDPAATEARFREILPRAVAAGDLDHELQLSTQIARTLGLQKRFDEAHQLLDAVDARLTEATPTARLRALLERGRAHRSGGQPDRAIPLFEEAHALGESTDQAGYALDAVHMIAISVDLEGQVEWGRKGLALAEAATDERARRWRGALYNNLGMALLELERHEEALEAFEGGLAVRLEAGQPDPIRIARWTVAHAKRKLGRCGEALAEQRRILAAAEEAGAETGFAEEEIGECLLALGREQEARPHFARAHEALRRIGWVAEDEARIARLAELGGAAEA